MSKNHTIECDLGVDCTCPVGNDYKGYVSKEHTIWCGTCALWVQMPIPTLSRMYKWAKRQGWKRSKAYGWQCPKCIQNEVK